MTEFAVGQFVNTPAGKANVLEQSGHVVFVILDSNGVEHSYMSHELQDWKQFERVKAVAASNTTRRSKRDELIDRITLGNMLLDTIFRDDPEGRAAFTEKAKEVLLARCGAILKAYEKDKKKD